MKGSSAFEYFSQEELNPLKPKLLNQSHVGVIGGGPAGSFFSYFLLDMAKRIGIDLDVDIYEPQDFFTTGPKGCNHCGGIISETLVQNLASEGINLPPEIIQRGIESYTMHTDTGSVIIGTPLHEKRIGAVHRGSGPKGARVSKWSSFDGFLLKMAVENGAHHLPYRIENISMENSKPLLITKDGQSTQYDLVAVAVGINTNSLDMFKDLNLGYSPPRTTKTFIQEYCLGEDDVSQFVGNSMHVFLVDIPKLEFAALIPKGAYVTLCMLGEDIDKSMIKSFFNFPKVRQCFPPDFDLEEKACKCLPKINIGGALKPYSDRLIFIGDCGVNRLYKDGIGVSYRAAKAAARTAIFKGISANEFKQYYWPICRNINNDNKIGKFIFFFIGFLQKFKFARQAIIRTVSQEQKSGKKRKDMSMILWDMFTGSANYSEIFLRTLHPLFLIRFLFNLIMSLLNINKQQSNGGVTWHPVH